MTISSREPVTDIIVLGRRLTDRLGVGRIFGLRLDRAAEVYGQLAGRGRIVVSGGDVGHCGVTEALVGSSYLTHERGVPASDIRREEQALDTVSNAVFCKLLLLENGSRKPIIISSCYHIPRVSFIFSHILGPDFEPTFVSAATGLDPDDYHRHWQSEFQKLLEAARFIEHLAAPPGAHDQVLDYLRLNGLVVEDTVE